MSATGKQLTNLALKEILTDAVVFRYQANSLDRCVITGIYDSDNASDAPYNSNPYGTLIVLNTLRMIVQIYIPDSVTLYQGGIPRFVCQDADSR